MQHWNLFNWRFWYCYVEEAVSIYFRWWKPSLNWQTQYKHHSQQQHGTQPPALRGGLVDRASVPHEIGTWFEHGRCQCDQSLEFFFSQAYSPSKTLSIESIKKHSPVDKHGRPLPSRAGTPGRCDVFITRASETKIAVTSPGHVPGIQQPSVITKR